MNWYSLSRQTWHFHTKGMAMFSLWRREFHEKLDVIYKSFYTWMVMTVWFFLPSVSDEDAAKMFPQHVVKETPSGKKYLMITPLPTEKDKP